MGEFFTSSYARQLKNRKGRPWVAVLKYQEPNPSYVPDSRGPMQQRKAIGRRQNPDYVPDEREAKQRAEFITKQITRMLDAEAAREITGDPEALPPADEAQKRKKRRASAKDIESLEKHIADDLARMWCEQMEKDKSRPPAASLTVAEYMNRYIERGKRVDGEELSESSKLDYMLVSKYFMRGESPVSEIMISDLRPTHVRDWEDALLAEGLSGVTVAKAHRLLHLICEDAFRLEMIDRNPCASIKPPRRSGETKRPNGLSGEGMAKASLTLATLSQTPKIVAAQIALYVGLRQGEVCGLRWRDVDLEGIEWKTGPKYQSVSISGPKLRVCHSIGRSNGGCYPKDELKSKNAYRIIPICGHLLEALRAHRAKMYEEWQRINEAVGAEPSEDAFLDLYVVGRVEGGFYNPSVLSRQWATTSKDLGLMGSDGRCVSFHDLRRTFSTICQANKVSEVSCKYVLGHSSQDLTTAIYTVPLADSVLEAAEIVARELDWALPENMVAAG